MRDIIQLALFGPADAFGMGMIPKHLIGEIKFRPNTNGCLDYANVKHQPTGTWSQIGLKTYIQDALRLRAQSATSYGETRKCHWTSIQSV